MYTKKADLSMNTIVVAIIAILVLIVLAGIFVTQLGDQSKNLQSCTLKAGVCSDEPCSQREDSLKSELPNTDCSKSGKYCCFPG
jgi:hypothetical protein